MPYTIAYVIKKKQQVDSLREIPKDKRPTEHMIWIGRPEDMEDWLDKAYGKKKEQYSDVVFIDEKEIEG